MYRLIIIFSLLLLFYNNVYATVITYNGVKTKIVSGNTAQVIIGEIPGYSHKFKEMSFSFDKKIWRDWVPFTLGKYSIDISMLPDRIFTVFIRFRYYNYWPYKNWEKDKTKYMYTVVAATAIKCDCLNALAN